MGLRSTTIGTSLLNVHQSVSATTHVILPHIHLNNMCEVSAQAEVKNFRTWKKRFRQGKQRS